MPRPFPAPFLRRLTIADFHQAGACAQGVDDAREQLGLWATSYPVSALQRRLKGLHGPDSYVVSLINRAAGRLYDDLSEAPYGECYRDGDSYGHGDTYGIELLKGGSGDGSGRDQMAYGNPGAALADGAWVGEGSGREGYYSSGYWDRDDGLSFAYEGAHDWPPYSEGFDETPF